MTEQDNTDKGLEDLPLSDQIAELRKGIISNKKILFEDERVKSFTLHPNNWAEWQNQLPTLASYNNSFMEKNITAIQLEGEPMNWVGRRELYASIHLGLAHDAILLIDMFDERSEINAEIDEQPGFKVEYKDDKQDAVCEIMRLRIIDETVKLFLNVKNGLKINLTDGEAENLPPSSSVS